MNTTLWIDQPDHFSMEHLEECALNDLERDMEVVYRARIIRRIRSSSIARKQP